MRYIDLNKILVHRHTWGNRQELWRDPKLVEDFRNYGYNKCWYTEVELAGHDPHIDHWRPKAEVLPYKGYKYNEPLRYLGYHWLANNPENYRLSCICANRKTGEGGKGRYFPLSDSSACLTPNGQEIEDPLLLDPCDKNDVKLVSFLGSDVIAATKDPLKQEKVRVSAEIYNMIDSHIKKKRRAVWDEIEQTIKEFEEEEISKKACIRKLTKAVDRMSEFSACAIACINSLAPDEIKDELGPLLDL